MLNLIEAKYLSRVKTYLVLYRETDAPVIMWTSYLGRTQLKIWKFKEHLCEMTLAQIQMCTHSKHGKIGHSNLYNLILCSRDYIILFSSSGSLIHSEHCLLSNSYGVTCAFFIEQCWRVPYRKNPSPVKDCSVRK